MLLVCVLSGTAISSEKESDTWTLLLTTPLTGHEIVRGKALGVARRMIWPMARCIAAHFVIFALCRVISWTGCLVVLWTMVSFNAIWVATGLYYSVRLKNNTFAVIANLLTPLCLYGGVPIVMLILGNLTFDTRANRAAEWTLYYMPYLYLGFGVEGLSPRHNWSWGLPNPSLDLPYAETGGMTPATFVFTVFVTGAVQLGAPRGCSGGSAAVGPTRLRAPQSVPLLPRAAHAYRSPPARCPPDEHCGAGVSLRSDGRLTQYHKGPAAACHLTAAGQNLPPPANQRARRNIEALMGRRPGRR